MIEQDNREIFAKNLRYYMNRDGKNQTDLVNDLEFKHSTLSEWLRGNKYPRIDKIEILSKYFRIEKSDLIENKQRTKNDEEIDDYLNQLHKRPEMKTLFSVTKNASKDEIVQITNMIKAFKKDQD